MKDNFVTIHQDILHALIRRIEKSDHPNPALTNMARRHTRKYNPKYKQLYLQQLTAKKQAVSESVTQAKAFLRAHRDKVLRYPGFNYCMTKGIPEAERLALCDKLRMLYVHKASGEIVCSVDDGNFKTQIRVSLSMIMDYNPGI